MSSPSRRDEILNTALKLFNEQGSANVSTRHIAEAMGISPGNLYYYFPHKEAIIHAILDRAEALFEGVYDFDLAHLPSPKSLLKRSERYFWGVSILSVGDDASLSKRSKPQRTLWKTPAKKTQRDRKDAWSTPRGRNLAPTQRGAQKNPHAKPLDSL